MLSKQGLFKRGNEAQSGFSANKAMPSSTTTSSPVRAVPLSTSQSSTPETSSHTPAPATPAVSSMPPAAKQEISASIDTNSGSRLIVGPEVKLKGAEILNCDTLVVEGRVEATMDSRVIQIAKEGAFSGKVGIDVAEVHGHFDGELTAREQLIIHATGKVSGKIRYGKIRIEEGGELSGDVAALALESGKSVSLHAADTVAAES